MANKVLERVGICLMVGGVWIFVYTSWNQPARFHTGSPTFSDIAGRVLGVFMLIYGITIFNKETKGPPKGGGI